MQFLRPVKWFLLFYLVQIQMLVWLPVVHLLRQVKTSFLKLHLTSEHEVMKNYFLSDTSMESSISEPNLSGALDRLVNFSRL